MTPEDSQLYRQLIEQYIESPGVKVMDEIADVEHAFQSLEKSLFELTSYLASVETVDIPGHVRMPETKVLVAHAQEVGRLFQSFLNLAFTLVNIARRSRSHLYNSESAFDQEIANQITRRFQLDLFTF